MCLGIDGLGVLWPWDLMAFGFDVSWDLMWPCDLMALGFDVALGFDGLGI